MPYRRVPFRITPCGWGVLPPDEEHELKARNKGVDKE
jgi:hypothetical protein